MLVALEAPCDPLGPRRVSYPRDLRLLAAARLLSFCIVAFAAPAVGAPPAARASNPVATTAIIRHSIVPRASLIAQVAAPKPRASCSHARGPNRVVLVPTQTAVLQTKEYPCGASPYVYANPRISAGPMNPGVGKASRFTSPARKSKSQTSHTRSTTTKGDRAS